MRDVEDAVRVKLAARLRLEREVPQGECRRHYVLAAAGAGELVDGGEGDEEVRGRSGEVFFGDQHFIRKNT